MSHKETTEDLNTSVGELANLMNDTFTCCMRNYEALLPYLEKKEIKLKIYHKLVQVNILLNKLNEELVGLRVEYVTVSSYVQNRETLLSEGCRKRRMSDVPEVGRHEAKSMKTEVPISCSSKSLSSESVIGKQSGNLVSMGTEETKQNIHMHMIKKIKTEIQDSNEVQDLPEFPIGNNETAGAQISCDPRNLRDTVSFADEKESAPVADRLVRDNVHDTSADIVTQREDCVPLQNVEREASNLEKNENIGNVFSEDRGIHRGVEGEVGCTSSFCYQPKTPFNSKESPVAFTACDDESAILVERRANIWNKGQRTASPSPIRYEKIRAYHSPIRYEKDQVPVQRSEVFSRGDELYGVIICENGKLKCLLCNRKLPCYKAVHAHVNGMKHKRKQIISKQSSCAKKSDVPDSNSESTAYVSLCASVSCSLSDTVAIVENNCSIESVVHAVKLDDMWKYFSAPFQINRKYFRMHSDQVMCSLCNLCVQKCVLSVKTHIIRPSHMNRIKRLTNFEIAWKSENRRMLIVPGIVNKCIPKTQFTLKNNGFFCKVCHCFCESDTVLHHLTNRSHGKKLCKMKKIVTVRKQKQ